MKFSHIALSLLSAYFMLNAPTALAAKVGTVSGDSVPLYTNPDSGSSSTATLLNGDVVTISNLPTKGFYKARTETGQTGWVEAGSLLIGEASMGEVESATLPPAAGTGQSTPANPGVAQVITPPANQHPQSADTLIPAPPSTPAPNAQPSQNIAEVPPPPTATQPFPNQGATNPPTPPTVFPAAPSAANSEIPPVPGAPAAAKPEEPPPVSEDVLPSANVPVHNLGSSTFTYEDVQPNVSYEVEAHRNGPRPVVHTYSGRRPYFISAFVGGDKVSMSDFNNLVQSNVFTSALYFGGEFGYALNDEVKLIARIERLYKSSPGGTADLNLSSIPLSIGVGFQIGRWKYIHFWASALFGMAFNTQVTATVPSAPAPNSAQLQENTFTEMVKLDASIPIYKAFEIFAEGGYRFLKTSSLTPTTDATGTSIFQVNGANAPTQLDLSGPFFGGGVSFQF